MRSDSYYSKTLVNTLIKCSIGVYIGCLVLSTMVIKEASAYNSVEFVPNYDKTFKAIRVVDKIEEEKVEDKFVLSEVKYDINTLYLDWSYIEAERKRLKEEEERKKQEALLLNNLNNSNFNSSIPTVDEVKPSTSIVVPAGSLPLPDLPDTSFKGYMCMHKVTAKSSKQWKFLHSGDFEFHTNENGILMYKDYYVVAMASYYTNYKVGSTFRITLDSGVVFDVITGDEKADKDTDSRNMFRPKGSNRGEIVEFVVACGAEGASCNKYHTMTAEERSLGNLSSLGFQGNVVKIEKLDDYEVSNYLYN